MNEEDHGKARTDETEEANAQTRQKRLLMDAITKFIRAADETRAHAADAANVLAVLSDETLVSSYLRVTVMAPEVPATEDAEAIPAHLLGCEVPVDPKIVRSLLEQFHSALQDKVVADAAKIEAISAAME